MIHAFFGQLASEEQKFFKLYKNNSDFDCATFFADYLNNLLRTGKSLNQPWDEAAEMLSAISTKWQCPEETILYRATFEDLVAPYISGNTYTYPAFMSTSEDEERIQRHWANSIHGRVPVMLSIRCPAASPMAPMDTSSTLPEGEFLLNRGSQFRIVERNECVGPLMVEIMGVYSKNCGQLIRYDLELIGMGD